MCSAGAYVQVAIDGPQQRLVGQTEDEALKKLMTQGKATELVVVTTDWKLEDAGGKTYGMCFVRVAPPYDHMNFKRGFSLPCPTHQRCALFSLILGMESIDSIPVTTEKPEFIIATKHAWVCDTLVRHKVDEWENKGHWPKHVAGVKGLLLRARDVMADLPGRSTLVFIPRDEDDAKRVNLISEKEDTDVDAIAKKGGGQQEIEKALRDMRMRGVMINELMASGARSSRPQASAFAKAEKKRKDKQKKKMPPVKQEDPHAKATDDNGKEGGDRGTVRPTEEHVDVAPVS